MNAWMVAGAVFGVLTLRYLLLSVLPYYFFWRWKAERYASARIQKAPPSQGTLWGEVKWSLSSFVLLSVISGGLFQLGYLSWTRVYFDFSERGWVYFLFSVGLLLLVHDTYFYWAHRFMHWGPIYSRVHKVHHESLNPSPLATFAFHPSEAVLESLIVGTMPIFIPVHPLAMGAFLVLAHVMNTLGHLGYEFFPSGHTTHPIGKWYNSSTHHNMHHQYFNSNYSLYLNVWDRIMGTNHPKYTETFEKVARTRPLVFDAAHGTHLLDRV